MTSVIGSGSLIGLNEVVVEADVVTPGEQAELVAWAEEQHRAGRLLENPRDAGAFQTPYQTAGGALSQLTRSGVPAADEGRQQFIWIPSATEQTSTALPDTVWRIRDRVVACLQIEAFEEDPYKGTFLTYAVSGAAVHQHLDATVLVGDEPCDILRCNVLFRRPESGGFPVINGTSVEIPDRGMWAFFPTALVHSATQVDGTTRRGTLSFGFIVRARDRWERLFRLSTAISMQYQLQNRDSRLWFLESIRRASGAGSLGADRLRLIEHAVLSDEDFSIRDTANALGTEPRATELALFELQRAGFVDSVSSATLEADQVMVF